MALALWNAEGFKVAESGVRVGDERPGEPEQPRRPPSHLGHLVEHVAANSAYRQSSEYRGRDCYVQVAVRVPGLDDMGSIRPERPDKRAKSQKRAFVTPDPSWLEVESSQCRFIELISPKAVDSDRHIRLAQCSRHVDKLFLCPTLPKRSG